MNIYFKVYCFVFLIFILIYEKFLDNEGNLDCCLIIDGLYYNEKGYVILREILEIYL